MLFEITFWGEHKSLACPNTNHGTQASNSVGDLDTSPPVNWDVLFGGIILTQLTYV